MNNGADRRQWRMTCCGKHQIIHTFFSFALNNELWAIIWHYLPALSTFVRSSMSNGNRFPFTFVFHGFIGRVDFRGKSIPGRGKKYKRIFFGASDHK